MPGGLLCARDMRMLPKVFFPSKLLKGFCTNTHTHTHTCTYKANDSDAGGMLETTVEKLFQSGF